MADLLVLIDQLIAEHKAFKEKFGSLETAMNDANIMTDLANAGDSFKPGAPGLKVNLNNIATLLENIGAWLERHFVREETILKPAVEIYGNQKINLQLNRLLFEHADLRSRMLHSKKRVAELIIADEADSLWQTAADEARDYLHHTNTLLQDHAAAENKLFQSVRKAVKKEK